MTTLDTIITSTIIKTIDDLTSSLDDLPGRMPQDRQIANALLSSVQQRVLGSAGTVGIKLARIRGADPVEAESVANALHGLALRLGAYLGRETR